MSTVSEAVNSANSPINAVLTAGLESLDRNDSVLFTKYIRLVLPLDGFVFWVKNDLVTQASSVTFGFNGTAYNGAFQNPIYQLQKKGSIHYSTDHLQNEDETIDKNQVIFTSETDIDELNEIAPNVLWIGEYDGIRFAFSRRQALYKVAGIFHYIGDAIYPALESQIIDDITQFDKFSLVVSNSMAIWLAQNQLLPIYPAHLVPANIVPAYAVISIDEGSQEALQSSPWIDNNGSHWQLIREKVKVIIYGLRNSDALNYLDYILNNSLNDDNGFGIMNMPIVKDSKKIQSELSAIAIKKTIEFEINYYQAAVHEIARQLILSSIPNYTVSTAAP